MEKFVNWIMGHNTLLYSIFFGIMLIVAVFFIVRFYIVNKSAKDFRYIAPLVITLIIFVYSFEQISFGHFYKILAFNMFTFYCLLAYLYADKIHKRKIVDWAYWFIVISSVLALFLCIFPAFKVYFIYGERFAGIFGNPNTLHFCSSIILACTLALFFRGHIGRIKMYLHSVVLVALGLSTCSKTFVILLAVLMIIYMLYEFTHAPKIALIELGILVLVSGIVYLAWGKAIIDYFRARISMSDAGSFMNGLTTYRWEMWVDYLNFWSVDPWAVLFGRGMSSMDFVYGGTHNDYVFLLYNLGLIGVALLIWLGVTYFILAKNKKKTFSVWSLVPVLTCLLVSMSENLLIRVFSLLIVLSTMFVFDNEEYDGGKNMINNSQKIDLSNVEITKTQKSKMKVSVLMSVYKNDIAINFDDAIKSILNQTYKPSQVVIVRDGKVGEDLQAVLDKYKDNKLFTIVERDENLGLGKTLAEGSTYCKYDYIARMDADDLSVPTRFEKQIKCFIADPELNVVSSNGVEFVNTLDKLYAIKNVPETDQEIKNLIISRSPVCHGSSMYTKGILDLAGGYQHSLYSEDWYLWIRMYLAGAKFYNIQENLLFIRINLDTYGRRHGMKYYKSINNLFKYMRKYKMMNFFEYLKYSTIRFVGHVLVPPKMKAILFKKFMRKGEIDNDTKDIALYLAGQGSNAKDI